MVIALEPKESFSVVVIDDEPAILQLMQDIFNDLPVRVSSTPDPEKGLEIIKREQPRLVFLDLNLPGARGTEILERIVRIDPRIEVVLITGDYSPSSAVEAIQKGAADYLTKPLSIAKLRGKVEQAIEAAQRHRQTLELDAELLSSFKFQGMVGRSPYMLDVFNKLGRIAPHFRSVLVAGPSGSGKELVARALHELSPVRKGPFVVCNCASIPESLAESEMFGYVRGSFTGATRDKSGFFEEADQGSIFLDEIGEMPVSMQAKLLRVLQTHEIQRVGSSLPRKLDLRVIAATNRDLREEVAEGRFREDLFYRLSSVHLQLPALAQRKEDLPLLQRYFVEKFAKEYKKEITGITRRAQNMLSRHSWPGNVRELENVIGSACMMCTGQMIDVDDLPLDMRTRASTAGDPTLMSLRELQQKHARDVLNQVEGNKARAAEILGISRSTLYTILAGTNVE
jgi:DNA-binding NtrC family response regulator